MKPLIKLIALGLSFIFLSTAQAQGNDLAPCLPPEAATMIWTADNEQPLRYFNVDELAAIEGEQVTFQGYAGDGAIADELESRGDLYPYGFKGINLHKVTSVGTLTLERDYGDIVGRVEVNRYLDDYLISFTTLDQYTAPGSYYDYHIIANPNGGACIWLISAEDWEVLGL